jgi:hypothetical protein
MKNYNKIIKVYIKNKYKASTNFNNNFINDFKLEREKLLNLVNQEKKQIKITDNKNDITYKRLKEKYFGKLKKKCEKEIIIYYKKFETNLFLKQRYNSKFRKTSNKETNNNSYIILGLLIVKTKKLNFYQKINCVLKIVDKFSLKKNIINKFDLFLLKKLLLVEKKFINKLI